MFQPIAIIGRACLLPGAHTPAELWKLVSERRVALGPVPDRHWRAGRERMLSSGVCVTDVGGVIRGFEKIWDPPAFPSMPNFYLHIGLAERFVRRVEREDPAGFAAHRGKPVMYLANHQVAVESILANILLSALSALPIKVVAKKEHRVGAK